MVKLTFRIRFWSSQQLLKIYRTPFLKLMTHRHNSDCSKIHPELNSYFWSKLKCRRFQIREHSEMLQNRLTTPQHMNVQQYQTKKCKESKYTRYAENTIYSKYVCTLFKTRSSGNFILYNIEHA